MHMLLVALGKTLSFKADEIHFEHGKVLLITTSSSRDFSISSEELELPVSNDTFFNLEWKLDLHRFSNDVRLAIEGCATGLDSGMAS